MAREQPGPDCNARSDRRHVAITPIPDHFPEFTAGAKMKQYHWDTVVAATLPPAEAIKLIRKLRWVGLEAAPLRPRHVPRVMAGVLADIPYDTD
jgi:hypothetical protein